MANLNSDMARSPLEHMWRQFVPHGHDQSLRNAFYNVAAAIFVGGAIAAAWSVYHILQPFVRALMWAVLFGSVLHPVKYKLSTSVTRWLHRIQETNSLVSISTALLPITCLDTLSEFIGWYIVNHTKIVVTATVVLPIVYLIIHHTPATLTHCGYFIISFLYYCIKYFLDAVGYFQYLVILAIAIYGWMVIFYWTSEKRDIYRRLSLPIWILAIALISGYYQSISVPLFIILFLLLLGGVWTEVKDIKTESLNPASHHFLASLVRICRGDMDSLNQKESEDKEGETCENISATNENSSQDLDETTDELRVPERVSRPRNLDHPRTPPATSPVKEECEEGSNVYLKGVFVACILVELWRHSYLLSLLPLSMGYYCIKKATSHHLFGESSLQGQVVHVGEVARENFGNWISRRHDVLLPLPIRGVVKLLKRSDRKVAGIVANSVDVFVTIFLMLGVIIFFILTSIFLAVQIQGEGMQLITMGTQVINATIVNNPQFHELLPKGLRDFMDSAIDNSYLYGREWISNMVRGMLGETSEEKAAELERQVVELWDRIYQAWVTTHPQPPFLGPVVTSEAVAVTFDSLVDGLMQTPGLISLSTLSDVVRENLGTVMSVLEGIWTILMSNLSLVLSAFSAASSLLLGGSLSILNALLNMVVFLSALFYILSISDSVYMPVGIISELAPVQMNSLGTAVEDSVNGVFKASFKMGAFYGMWTWLLHSIFATNIVYIPAVLGALFGAVPLVGTYWAAVPGALELFWGHGSPFMAFMLIGAQLLPLSCVDTAFYAEIKGGGHPYLTGLAVAGGIFCWGVEGAILGPLLLCILLVITKMYTSLIQTPSDFSHRFKILRRCQSEIMN